MFLKNDWIHDYLILKEEYVIQLYDNFQGTLEQTKERLLSYEGVENGISINYYFKLIDSKWFLVKYENFSN